MMRVHPDPGKRYQVLHETQHLFAMSRWVAFGVGFSTGIALLPIQRFMISFSILAAGQIGIQTVSDLPDVGIALIIAPLIVGIIGLSIWRATFAALVQVRSCKALVV
jgi:hypothetical protein